MKPSLYSTVVKSWSITLCFNSAACATALCIEVSRHNCIRFSTRSALLKRQSSLPKPISIASIFLHFQNLSNSLPALLCKSGILILPPTESHDTIPLTVCERRIGVLALLQKPIAVGAAYGVSLRARGEMAEGNRRALRPTSPRRAGTPNSGKIDFRACRYRTRAWERLPHQSPADRRAVQSLPILPPPRTERHNTP